MAWMVNITCTCVNYTKTLIQYTVIACKATVDLILDSINQYNAK